MIWMKNTLIVFTSPNTQISVNDNYMKTIQMFEAEDGTRFSDGVECIRYETLLGQVNKCHGILRKAIDENCEFANGGGYVQQSPAAIAKFDAALEKLLKDYFDPYYEDIKLSEMYRRDPIGIIGRYLEGDVYSRLANALCWRRVTIDDHNREWGQPFYAPCTLR